ncbi:MAG: hypothetical protein ACK50A_09640 [Sphingobacteriaceae bacterium]
MMNSFKYLKFFGIVIAISCFFSCCSVQKRIHRKGFYITHHVKTEIPNKNSINEDQEVYASVKANNLNISDSKQLIEFQKPSRHLMPLDTCGDVLVLSNYSELLVKIINISDSTIEYVSCSCLNGKSDQMLLKNIKMIHFVNGSEVFYDRTFEQEVKSPLCYDLIILKDNTKIKAKIISENEQEIKYVECARPGVIQKLQQKEVEKYTYYNDLLFAEDEDEELNKELKGSLALSIISLIAGSLVPVFFSMFGGGGITGFTFLLALVLYTIAMVRAWKLYEKVSRKRNTKLNKRAKFNLIFAFLPVELLAIASILFVLVFSVVLIIAMALSQ